MENNTNDDFLKNEIRRIVDVWCKEIEKESMQMILREKRKRAREKIRKVNTNEEKRKII